MAYEPSAAPTSQTAEISSPRASASTPQQTAPTMATAVHTRIVFGLARDRGVDDRDTLAPQKDGRRLVTNGW
ncbi:hypothetical protein GCM10010387_49540 [Streptomyces inusitatus]|uniref:Uncharacterized protein n=1 Tax=Streptomyces inusitatus TaxID=68221 RepID=A0A918UZI5_9ACTN|nr:hypothetical protein GCM10010387_49540 [Streptomyces inusitatus]